MFAARSVRRWKCRRPRSQTPTSNGYSCCGSGLSMTLHHFSIQLVMIIERLVKIDSRCKLQRLLVAESKDAKHAQTVVKQIMNARLEILVEIDHHVATQDYLKLVEGTVCSKIVFGKHHVAFKY